MIEDRSGTRPIVSQENLIVGKVQGGEASKTDLVNVGSQDAVARGLKASASKACDGLQKGASPLKMPQGVKKMVVRSLVHISMLKKGCTVYLVRNQPLEVSRNLTWEWMTLRVGMHLGTGRTLSVRHRKPLLVA